MIDFEVIWWNLPLRLQYICILCGKIQEILWNSLGPCTLTVTFYFFFNTFFRKLLFFSKKNCCLRCRKCGVLWVKKSNLCKLEHFFWLNPFSKKYHRFHSWIQEWFYVQFSKYFQQWCYSTTNFLNLTSQNRCRNTGITSLGKSPHFQ